MSTRRPPRKQTAAELRSRIRAFDDSIQPPADLFERIKAPALTGIDSARPRRRWPTAALAAATMVGIVAGAPTGAWWMNRRQSPPALATHESMTLTVYNAEKPCQRLRTIECSIGIVKNPRIYSAGNVIARAWHGDKFTATCVITDGEKITDEEGVSSLRWYRIRLPNGDGYFPGARTRNTTEVPICNG